MNRDFIQDMNVIRGDLELLELTKNSTEVKYYSGWVDETLLKPYLTIVPEERPQNIKSSPLDDFTVN